MCKVTVPLRLIASEFLPVTNRLIALVFGRYYMFDSGQ
jgi:hypothetical protein